MSLPSNSIPNYNYGEYTAPYYGTVSGSPTILICDDFESETPVPGSWQANVTTPSSGAKFTNQNVAAILNSTVHDNGAYSLTQTQQAYNAIAYLAVDLINNSANDVVDSFAIWDIFDESGVHTHLFGSTAFLSQVDTAAKNALTNAPAGESADISIYTPTSSYSSIQEFVSVKTPEASSPWILAVDLLTLGPIALFFRRRNARNAQ